MFESSQVEADADGCKLAQDTAVYPFIKVG